MFNLCISIELFKNESVVSCTGSWKCEESKFNTETSVYSVPLHGPSISEEDGFKSGGLWRKTKVPILTAALLFNL